MADEKDKKVGKKNLKDELEDISQLSNILESQDIDQMLEYLRSSGHINKHNVLDLNPLFIDKHSNGVEMFMKMAIKLEPENPNHHYNYALFLENEKLYDQAKNEFETAIKLDTENENFRLDYGNLLFLLQEYKDAEKEYKAAIVLNPNSAHIWTNLGILYYKRKEHQKAIDALKQAINIDPNYPLSYLNLLQLYRTQNMAGEAQALWKKYKSLEVQDLGINILQLNSKSSRDKQTE
jgi:tetratricopeptide (TPR) repeat protein